MSQRAGIFGDMPTGQVLLIGAIILMTMTLMRNMRRRKVPNSRAAAPEPRPARSALADAQKAGDDIAVRLHEQFREWNARIDTKALVIGQLLSEADQRIAELQALTRVVATPTSPEPAPNRAAAADEPLLIEPDATGPATTHSPSKAPSVKPADPLDPMSRSAERFADIFQLADQGLSTADIARSTHQAEAEIELILSLRDRASARPAH